MRRSSLYPALRRTIIDLNLPHTYSRRSDMTNERMPEFHESNLEFPALQAPSTRMRFGSPDDSDIDKKFRCTLESEEDDELSALAERLARIRRPGARPSQTLKRHDTVKAIRRACLCVD